MGGIARVFNKNLPLCRLYSFRGGAADTGMLMSLRGFVRSVHGLSPRTYTVAGGGYDELRGTVGRALCLWTFCINAARETENWDSLVRAELRCLLERWIKAVRH